MLAIPLFNRCFLACTPLAPVSAVVAPHAVDHVTVSRIGMQVCDGHHDSGALTLRARAHALLLRHDETAQ
jgi:hypothetical protein